MFHPVGHHSPSVYWRRRLLLVASLVVLLLLITLTVKTMTSSGGQPAGAAAPQTHASSVHRTPSPTPTSSSPSSRRRHQGNGVSSDHGSSVSGPSGTDRTSSKRSHPASTSSAPPARCSAHDLAIQAVVARSTYQMGQDPVLELQVTNDGTAPCVQDLADRQIVLKVYNGESRVWGSHDCQIEPGTADRVLAVGQPVRVSITWSGYTSRPQCAGTRQRVGAGTYTLYASLSGHSGKAAQFSIV